MLQGIFNLSDAQVKDLMFLREVYVVKESELNLQQASLTACLQNRIPDPMLEVTRVVSIGTELKVKAAECHKLLHRLCWAMYFGVSHYVGPQKPCIALINIALINIALIILLIILLISIALRNIALINTGVPADR